MKKRAKKQKPQKVDNGLGEQDVKRIRTALRRVWGWNYSRKICVERAIGKDGFPRCEQCRKKVPKVFPDHIEKVGDVDAGFIFRLFVPSNRLQALCKKCHDAKTRHERALSRLGLD